MKKYDSIIIGSGQGGTPFAFDLTSKGEKVALIEKKYLGGSCINFGCIPTKALVASSNLLHRIKTSTGELAIRVDGASIDFKKVMDRKDKIIKRSRKNIENKIKEDENLDLYRGLGSFVDKNTIKIKLNDGSVEEISGDKIFINAGSKSNIIPIDGIEDIKYYDSTSILELTSLPKHLVIIGTSYIALEFGQIFKRFGSKVTMIGRGEHILDKEDEDVSKAIQEILENEDIEFILEADTKEVSSQGDSTVITLERNDKEETLKCSHLMLATGRVPLSKDLKLENAGVETDDKGNVKVDSKLTTNIEGIYAIGDIKGGPQFTHISFDDYKILKNNLFGDKTRSTDDRPVPFTLFTDPQLGRVGLTEKQALDKGYDIEIGKVHMDEQTRPKLDDQTKGFLKAVVDNDSKKILGVAMLGHLGGELMAMIEIAMMADMTYDKLRDGVFSHPNYSEILNNLFDI